jgi:hypothetical protein
MTERGEGLQLFKEAAYAAFDEFVHDPESRRTIRQIFKLLEQSDEQRNDGGSRLPVCSHLSSALSISTDSEILRRLMARFQAIEPLLAWRRREDLSGTSSVNFDQSHANAMIIGPGGIEARSDVWLGATLMAPRVRYPDHDHAPEEVYLVMSDGEFQHGASGWFAPGIGGSFYNPPNIRHAMRSVDTPLFAFWALLPARKR